jgi:TDG/mug DNA glycosylase family protein
MLPDLIGPTPRLVFCGTAAGRASAARGHYYAGPGNRFWPILAETGLTPRLFRPEEDGLLPGLGLGLTDLAKGVAGMDHEIPHAAFVAGRIDLIVREFRPAGLAFTSLAAGRLALGRKAGDRAIGAGPQGRQARWPGVAVFVLPSPSGAARGSFSPEPWYQVAEWARQAAGDKR